MLTVLEPGKSKMKEPGDSISSKPLLWRGQWHPTPVLLPGKSHGWRSLVGCSPWGLEESDMTERLHFHFSLSSIGEGNGNLSGRESSCQCMRGGFNPWVWDMPGEENGNPLHHNILAWGIPWTEEPWRLQSMGSQKSQTWLSRLNNNNRDPEDSTDPSTMEKHSEKWPCEPGRRGLWWLLFRLLSHVWLLQPQGLETTRLFSPWDFPNKNTGVGCHFLLWVIFLTQESTRVSYVAGGFFTTGQPGKSGSLL